MNAAERLLAPTKTALSVTRPPAPSRPGPAPRATRAATAATAGLGARHAPGAALLGLQRTAGNAAVVALLGERAAGPGPLAARHAPPLGARVLVRALPRRVPAGGPAGRAGPGPERPRQPGQAGELVRSAVDEARTRLEGVANLREPLPARAAAGQGEPPEDPSGAGGVPGAPPLQRAVEAGGGDPGAAEAAADADRRAAQRQQLAATFREDMSRHVQALASGSLSEIMRLTEAGEARKAAIRAGSEAELATVEGEIEARGAEVEAANTARQGTLLAGMEGQAEAVRSSAATEQAAVGAEGAQRQTEVVGGGGEHATAIGGAGAEQAASARERIEAQAAEAESAAAGGYGGGEKGAAQRDAATRVAARGATAVAAAGPAIAGDVLGGGKAASGGVLGWASRMGGALLRAAAPFVQAIGRLAGEVIQDLRRRAAAAVSALARFGGRILDGLRDLARRVRALVTRLVKAAEELIDRAIARAVEQLRAKTEDAVARTNAKLDELATAVEAAEGAGPGELEELVGRVRGAAAAKVADSVAEIAAGVDRAVGRLDQYREQVAGGAGTIAADAARTAGEDATAGRGGQETLAGHAEAAGASIQARAVARAGGLTASFRTHAAGLAGTALGALGAVAGQALAHLTRVAGDGVGRNRAEVAERVTARAGQAAGEVGADHDRSLASRVVDALGKLVGGAWNAAIAVGRAVARAAVAPLAWAAGAAAGALGELVDSRLAPALARLEAPPAQALTGEGLLGGPAGGLDLDRLARGLRPAPHGPPATAAIAIPIGLALVVFFFLALLFLYFWVTVVVPLVRGKGFPKFPTPVPTVKPVPTAKPAPKPAPKPEPKPGPKPGPVDPPPLNPCRDRLDPCPHPLPISWPGELPLPRGGGLVRTPGAVRDEEGLGGRGSAQRQMNEEIAEARRLRVPPPRPCDPRVKTDESRWNDPFDAHHIHPLFLGGVDVRGNLCALEADKHQSGHPRLANQPEHLDDYLACRICSPNLFLHPAFQEYVIAGRK